MKNLLFILAVVILASCSQSTRKTDTKASPLYAKMTITPNIAVTDSILMRFTVYNDADSVQQFCKWHTPFEPLLSKYLDITNESGEEANYQGAMAKRMMPPPADSYLKVQPNDSLSVVVNVSKGYNITKPSTYYIKYNAQNMSGLIVKDSVSFRYGK